MARLVLFFLWLRKEPIAFGDRPQAGIVQTTGGCIYPHWFYAVYTCVWTMHIYKPCGMWNEVARYPCWQQKGQADCEPTGWGVALCSHVCSCAHSWHCMIATSRHAVSSDWYLTMASFPLALKRCRSFAARSTTTSFSLQAMAFGMLWLIRYGHVVHVCRIPGTEAS